MLALPEKVHSVSPDNGYIETDCFAPSKSGYFYPHCENPLRLVSHLATVDDDNLMVPLDKVSNKNLRFRVPRIRDFLTKSQRDEIGLKDDYGNIKSNAQLTHEMTDMLNIPPEFDEVTHRSTKEFYKDCRHRLLRVCWHSKERLDFCHGCGRIHSSKHWSTSKHACIIALETIRLFGINKYTCTHIAWLVHRGIKNLTDTERIMKQINRISMMKDFPICWFTHWHNVLNSCKYNH